MKSIVNQVHRLLLKKDKTVAVAESCTGGRTSCLLTSLSGSSGYFVMGVVAYSNRVKITLLKVPARLIRKNGAVSAPVARAMADGVRRLAGADFGIGITGVAGPTGGTCAKPVGTVYIAARGRKGTIDKRFYFRGTRPLVRRRAAYAALKLLKELV